MRLVSYYSVLLVLFLFLNPYCSVAQSRMDKQIDKLSTQIAGEIEEYNKQKVAVVEFSDLQGNVTNLGRYLSEEMITRLFETGKFKVVERQLLNKVIDEQELKLKGVVNPESAQKLGEIIGVGAIVSGTITNLAESVKVNARLISTETGEVFSVASASIYKSESVVNLIQENSDNIDKEYQNANKEENTGNKKSTRSVFEKGNIKIKVKKCEYNGKMKCTMSMTYTGDGRKKMYITDDDSKIIDGRGKGYGAHNGDGRIVLGSDELGFNYSGRVYSELISGIPVEVILSYQTNNKPSTVRMVQLGNNNFSIVAKGNFSVK